MQKRSDDRANRIDVAKRVGDIATVDHKVLKIQSRDFRHHHGSSGHDRRADLKQKLRVGVKDGMS